MSNIKINMDALNPKSFKKTVRHKVQDGDNIYRFLPPFGPEADGYPYRKWGVIWGLIDPSSGRMRPFASPSTYEGQCPVYDYLDLLKQKVDTIENEETAKKVNEFISTLRPKSVYAYNATDKSGQVGVLELKPTAHKKIISLMNQYINDYSQDPTSLNSEPSDSGVWFNITRTGRGFDTVYDAKKNQTMVKDANGVPSYQDDRSALAENIVQNFDSVAYDLSTIYQKLTYDELKDVLIANIVHAAQEIPELLVPGFDGTDGEITEVVDTPANGAVNVPLNTGGQEIAHEVNTAAVTNKDTADVLKMADEIFNSN